MTRDEKAACAEVAKFRAMPGVTVFDGKAPRQVITIVSSTPPRAQWLACWRKVFKDSRHD